VFRKKEGGLIFDCFSSGRGIHDINESRLTEIRTVPHRPRRGPSEDRPMIERFLVNYIQRHQHPLNQVLHLVGVPLTFVVSVVFLFQHRWWWALGAFLGGYILQFVGHAIEGNDAGETILVKRALGLPFIDIVPRTKTVKE
jgi:hypothetical protein